MKTYFLNPFFSVLFAVIFLNFGPKVFAQSSPPDGWQSGAEGGWYVEVDEDDTLNVRSLPTHKAAKVGVVKRGTEITILDTSENGWRFIEAGSASGWVNGNYLTEKFIAVKGHEKGNTENTQNFESENSPTIPKRAPKVGNPQSAVVAKDDFEVEFEKYRELFRGNDRCFSSLKRRTELVSLSAQIERYDPVGFRNLKNKYDECVGALEAGGASTLEGKVRALADTDAKKSRYVNFNREYTTAIEDAAVLIGLGQMMGISFE